MKKTITQAIFNAKLVAFAPKTALLAFMLLVAPLANAQTNCTGVYTTIPAGTNWTTTTSYLGGTALYIAGNVTVSANVTFHYCDIIVANGATITMSGSSSVLTIEEHTHIYACGTDMWGGIIKGTGTGLLTIKENSLIEDATTAVTINNGSSFLIQDVMFNRNNIGINITSTTNAIASSIQNTLFTSRTIYPVSTYFAGGGLLNTTNFNMTDAVYQSLYYNWASATMNNGSGHLAQIGIKCTSVTNSIQIGDDTSAGNLNTFDNLSIGISLTFSNAVIYNNQFYNLIKSTSLGTLGYGVYTAGTTNGPYSLTVGGPGSNQLNSFQDNYIALYVNFYRLVNVLNNSIKQTITNASTGAVGVYIKPSGNVVSGVSLNPATVHVLDNLILNSSTGILIFRQTSGWNADEIILGENSIGSGATSTMFCKIGIDLQDATQSSLMGIDKYKVRNNGITNVYNGIKATNVTNIGLAGGCLIVYNDPTYSGSPDIRVIHTPSAGSLILCGIQLQNCVYATVYNNVVTSTDATVATASNYKGIYLVGCKAGTETCNTISNYYESLSYNGNNGSSFIRNNTMSKGHNGLALRNSGYFSTQGSSTDNCGLWWDTGAGTGFTNQTFTDAAASNPNFNSVLYMENTTYTTTSTFITFPTLNATGTGVPGTDNYLSGSGLMLSGVLGFTFDCAGVVVGMATQGGGEKSMEQSGTSKLLALVNDTIQYGGWGDEERYQNKILAYNILDTTNGVTDDTTGILQNFYDSTQSAAIGQFREVRKAIGNMNFGTAETINNSVTTSNTIEANEKLVNHYDIFKQTYPDSAYSSADSSAIYSVASQCPSSGGAIVWAARIIYFSIVGERVDFPDTCVSEERSLMYKPSIPVASDFKLFPNPNNGTMTLDYHIGNAQTGLLSIYDMTGKLISSQNFNGSGSRVRIDAELLNAGAYYYEIKIDNIKTKADKLIIIK